MYAQPDYVATAQSTDRLVDASSLSKEVPSFDIQAADDIMDERSNPIAQHLNQMITTSTQTHRQATLQQLQDIREHKKPTKRTAHKKTKGDEPPADYWFMNQPQPTKLPKDYATFSSATVQPGAPTNNSTASPLTTDEQQLLTKVHQQQADEPVAYGHTPVLQPIGSSKAHPKHKQKTAKPTMTQTPDPAILNLANNDDLTVATIARQANKKSEPELPEGEVVISLR